jgi:hypothetical protein
VDSRTRTQRHKGGAEPAMVTGGDGGSCGGSGSRRSRNRAERDGQPQVARRALAMATSPSLCDAEAAPMNAATSNDFSIGISGALPGSGRRDVAHPAWARLRTDAPAPRHVLANVVTGGAGSHVRENVLSGARQGRMPARSGCEMDAGIPGWSRRQHVLANVATPAAELTPRKSGDLRHGDVAPRQSCSP